MLDFSFRGKSATIPWGCSSSHGESHVWKNRDLQSSANNRSEPSWGVGGPVSANISMATSKEIPNQNHTANPLLKSWTTKTEIKFILSQFLSVSHADIYMIQMLRIIKYNKLVMFQIFAFFFFVFEENDSVFCHWGLNTISNQLYSCSPME